MKNTVLQNDWYGREKISKILLKVAPPVMLAQLIQALYNIVDSFFVGMYSNDALTALSVIYPMQLVIIALAVGTGVGVNTYMARKYAQERPKDAEAAAGCGTVLALVSWALFAALSLIFMRPYVKTSATSPEAVEYAVIYGNIVCAGSIGVFLEGNWTKVHQARGNMRRPMIAQITGALTNIILDPILIFGIGPAPEMGVAGAAAATVIGQICAAVIVSVGAVCKPPELRHMRRFINRIYFFGYSSILMQLLYTVYILALNIILAGFSDAAVTVLGLYYKLQSFFFIPLFGLQTCIVPVLSFNFAKGDGQRCRQTMNLSFLISSVFMLLGIVCFVFFPVPMIRLFSDSSQVIEIGKIAFPIIGAGFVSAVFGIIMPTFFQAIGKGAQSTFLSLLRQIFCLIPIFWAFSLVGLNCTWLAFPLSETISGVAGLVMYRAELKKWSKHSEGKKSPSDAVLRPSRPGVIITIAREHGSSGKQIGKVVAERLGIPFYYKEMTALAAEESGLDREFISDINANSPKILHDLYLSTHVVQQAVAAQDRIIRRIAENGSCVIVGRSADYVLRDHPDLFRVFVYAPKDFRIKRLGKVYGDDPETAEKNIRRSDGARAAYYRNISGWVWGERENYDLMISSEIGIESSADIICKYAAAKENADRAAR